MVRFPGLSSTAPVSKISLFPAGGRGLRRIRGGFACLSRAAGAATISKISLFVEMETIGFSRMAPEPDNWFALVNNRI